MKKVYLIISLVLTLIVFSMSIASGETSGSLSLSITRLVNDFLNYIFPNNNIVFENLHIFIRKSAHIVEYMLLGIVWFLTIKEYKKSLATLLALGLTIAIIDESIQLIAIDRGSSILDVILYDFLPFSIISIALVVLHNRKEEGKMSLAVLARLEENKITTDKAYKQLFKKEKIVRVPFFKRAHFIKLRIVVPEEKGVTAFLRVLFFLPVPIVFLRIILGFVKIDKYSGDLPLSKREIINLICHRGVKVQVKAKSGERVLIKTL